VVQPVNLRLAASLPRLSTATRKGAPNPFRISLFPVSARGCPASFPGLRPRVGRILLPPPPAGRGVGVL
jgi:hypothetical protein